MKLVKHVTTASRARDKQRRFRFFFTSYVARYVTSPSERDTRDTFKGIFSFIRLFKPPQYIYIYTYTDTHTQTYLISHLIPKLAIPNLDVGESKKEWKENNTRFFRFHIRERASANWSIPPPKKTWRSNKKTLAYNYVKDIEFLLGVQWNPNGRFVAPSWFAICGRFLMWSIYDKRRRKKI